MYSLLYNNLGYFVRCFLDFSESFFRDSPLCNLTSMYFSTVDFKVWIWISIITKPVTISPIMNM